MNNLTGHVKVLMVLTVFLLGTLQVAIAAPSLNLNFLDAPDIKSSGLDLTYVELDNIFMATGFADTFDDGSGAVDIDNGVFTLTASIDDNGFLFSGGVSNELTIGYTSGTLLAGNLTAFGSGGASDPLEFLFSVTGGDLADSYGGIGATGGVILTSSNFAGNFTNDFSSAVALSNTGIPDTPVPEPATLFLLGIGLLGISRFSRRKI